MTDTFLLGTYRKLLDLFSPQERRRFYMLLVLILFMGIAQMVGVAAILPFLAVLANPGVIETNAWLNWAYEGLGFDSHRSFLIFVGAAVFCVVVFSLMFKMVTQYALYRFANMRSFTISTKLLRGYLHQPYSWFLDRHTSDLQTTILAHTPSVMAHSLTQAMRLISQGAVIFFIVVLLVIVNPAAALVLGLFLGGSFGLVYLAIRRRLTRIGEERARCTKQRFKIGGDALGGIKDVKLLGLEETFARRFSRPARRMAEVEAINVALADVPRFMIEAVAFGGMLLFVLFLLATGDGTLEGILPIIGVYAFAAFRMFPALQQVYASFAAMRYSRPTLDQLHADVMANPRLEGPVVEPPPPSPLRLARRLELDRICYAYPQAERTALEDLDMTIEARSTVGIVGGTGAGKTTVIDIILGLLVPQKGELRVDGVPITDANRRAWQRSIGYVPQSIFLVDDTVSANIAFGRDPQEIDQAAVERAARLAALHDFVTGELPQGYDTLIGERGVRLSGGQRQRIGIARALYTDPDVLVLDEATSALDNLTEREVMEAVGNLGRAKTIIMIAHRLSTVRNCDVIHLLENGRIVASGSYEELVRDNAVFRAMAATG